MDVPWVLQISHDIWPWTMTKSSMLLAATVLAGTASAFAPPNSARVSSRLYEDVAATEDVAEVAPTAPTVSAMDDMVGAIDLRGKEFKFDPVRESSKIVSHVRHL